MDLKIIHRSADGALSFSFGMKPRTRLFSAVSAGSNKAVIEDVSGFRAGMKVLVGDFAVGSEFDPGVDDYINELTVENVGNSEVLTVQAIDIPRSSITFTPPLATPRPAYSAVVAIAADYKAELYQGLMELCQYVEKVMLTSVGSDALEQDLGSRVYSLLGLENSEDNQGLIMTKMNSIVSEVESFIRKNQDRNGRSDDELLNRLIVRSAYYDYNISRWRIDIDVISASGKSYISSL